MNSLDRIKPILIKTMPSSLIDRWHEYNRQRYCSNKYKNEECGNPGDYYSLNPFDYYQCIFVHIPKAAGISVNKTLFGNLAGGHYTIKDYQNIFKEHTFKKYFKFTIVRNPYDRLYSAYTFLKSGGFNNRDACWANENLLTITSYEQFVKEWLTPDNIYTKEHFTPQFEFLINREGQIAVDFIGRLENINIDFEVIRKKIGINKNLIHTNKTLKKENVFLDNEMKEIIQSVYQKDFELLDYSYE